MLYVYPNGLGSTDLNDDIQFCMQPDVFCEDIIRRAVADVDEVYKIEGLAMYSKRHGVKSPASLSNGIKALILCYYQATGKFDGIVSNACMGENVGPYLQELSLKYDIHITWDYWLHFDWDSPIEATDVSTGKTVRTVDDFQKEIGWKGGHPDVPSTEFKGL